jgi:hypothetical protein
MKIMFALGLALLMAQTVAFGQTIHLQPSATFPRFTVAEGQLDEDGFPISGAKLCLVNDKRNCYLMPSHTAEGSGRVTYDFGLEPHAKILPLTNGGSWAFFSALFSAGGSGTLTRLAILRYQSSEGKDGVLTNLLPYVAVTNVSEHALWTVPSASPYPVLVHADFIWSSGETHLAPHFYTVEAWRFDTATDRYRKTVSYRTSKKYEGGDSGTISVLGPERAEILRQLSTR